METGAGTLSSDWAIWSGAGEAILAVMQARHRYLDGDWAGVGWSFPKR
jgi:hypothetical protein